MFFLFVESKSQEPNFINITTDMGLPANECYRITQDKQGYIWVSTEMGLAKYNGREFILFDASKGLPFRNIYALDADSSGRIWFATGDWKVGYILEDKVKIVCTPDMFENPLKIVKFQPTGDVIYKIKYVKDENVLYLSNHSLSYKIYENNGKWTCSNINSKNLKRDFSIHYTNGKIVYIANEMDTTNFIQTLNGFKKKFSLGSVNINNNNTLIIPNYPLTTSKTEVFNTFDSKNNYFSFQNYLFTLSTDNRIINRKKFDNDILSFCIDNNNLLWIGLRTLGLQIFNSKKNTHCYLFNNLSITNILQDTQGNIWLTTLEKGMFFCSNSNIAYFNHFFSNNGGVNFIKETNKNLFVANSEQMGLVNKQQKVILLNKLYLPRKSSITDILFYKNKYLLGFHSGMYLLNEDFTLKKEIYHGKETIGVIGFLVNSKNTDVFLYQNVTFWKINNLSSFENCFIDIIRKIKYATFIGKDSILCITKNDIQLLKINVPKKEESKTIMQNNNSVVKFLVDSSENYWLLGVNDTLQILKKNFEEKQKIILHKQNLYCRNILQISKSHFLISTNNGLFFIQLNDSTYKNYTIKVFNEANGLNSNDIYNVVFFNNKYFVSTSKGICSFDKIEDLYHKSPPNTIINSISVNEKSVTFSDTIYKYNQNTFTFNVDALTYKKILQKGVFYKYKLVGYDDEFKVADGYTITYNNLAAGKYTFIAKAFYDDETEDTTPAVFSFTINPPFWLTWWGVGLIVLLSCGIILLYIQWQIKKYQKKQDEKLTIQKTIAEYKFTALKAQMNPHFVFNSVNVIQNLILEKDKTEAYNALGNLAKLIRKILNQSNSVYSTVEEEVQLINSYVDLNKLRVEYPFEFFTNIAPNTLQCQIPSLLIQPFIENALWHGILPLQGSKVGIIKLHIQLLENDILQIIIQDNGIGRKASAENKTLSSNTHISKGLQLIQERLEAYKTLNKNCMAQLKVEDIDEGNFKGTFVEIKIQLPNEDE